VLFPFPGFRTRRPVPSLGSGFLRFGIAGGLEHFRTTFDVVDREILLLPKPSLPATTAAAP
jgi:hypothetical protein